MRRIILGLMFVVASAGIAGADEKFALVIGVSGYPSYPEDGRLRYTDDDAEYFKWFIMSPEGRDFPAANVRTLLNQQATRENIYRELDWLSNRVTSADIVYIFFAGHGQPDKTDRVYLMPYEGNPTSPAVHGIRADTFIEDINARISPRQLVLFIDACYSASIFSPGGAARLGTDENVSKAIRDKWASVFAKQAAQRMAFLSTASQQKSWEDDKLKHGLFTWFLVEGMRGAADVNPRDGLITAGELRRYVLDRVEAESTLRFAEQQSPTVSPTFDPAFVMAVRRLPPLQSPANPYMRWGYVRAAGTAAAQALVAERASRVGLGFVFDASTAGLAWAEPALDVTPLQTSSNLAAGSPPPVRTFGFINAQALADRSARGQAIKERLSRQSEQRKTEIAALSQKLEAARSAGRPASELDQLQQQLVSQTSAAQAELDKLTASFQDEFIRQITPHIEAVARAAKAQVIFNMSDAGVIWTNPQLDLTNAVLARFEPVAGAPQPSAPAIPPLKNAGFVDLQRLVNESKIGRSFTAQIKTLSDARSKELRSLEARRKTAAQPEQVRLEGELSRKTAAAQEAVSQLQTKLQNDFQTVLMPVLNQVATVRGYTVVFSRADAGLVYAASTLDATDVVLGGLGR
jgi:Skp family chaperone for outer membrane proteins